MRQQVSNDEYSVHEDSIEYLQPRILKRKKSLQKNIVVNATS